MMSGHSVTETTSTGWFSRIGDSIKGIVVGIILILAAFPVLFINEGCAVKMRKTLDQGSKEVVHVDAATVDKGNDAKLIHLTGQATAQGELEDPQFHVKADALKLKRRVEMFQWKEESSTETKKKLGGGEESVTTYTYTKTWNEGRIDSSKFNQPGEYSNPSPTIQSQTLTAKPVTIGGFTLNNGLIGQISSFTPIHVEGKEPQATETTPKKKKGKKDKKGKKNKKDKKADSETSQPEATPSTSGLRLVNGQYYSGNDPSNPQIGDLRISFQKVADPTEVSIIAQQVGQTFEPFTGKSGASIEILEIGKHSAEAMFEKAQNNNIIRTWIVRGVGFIMMFIGFGMFFKPLSVVADVLPIAGTIVGVGTSIVAFLLSASLSLCTIAIAWIFYRPLVGIPLLIAASVGIFFLIKKMARYKKSQA